MTAELEPVAWIIPGNNNASDYGFFDAMAWQEVEFSLPLVTLSSAQEAIDKREERIRELEAALDHDPDGSGLWRYWSSKSSEIAQKLVEEIDRAEVAEARASALQALLDEVGEVIEPFLRQLDALHESWPDDWRLDVIASERWHLKVGDFRAARSLAAKIKEASHGSG